MLIKKVAFGDPSEAFIEKRFESGVNVIFSDDNNRGKTLVMQGMMYSIGYEAIFPSSFDYRDKYFYSEVDVDGVTYEFLRKKNSFVVKTGGSMQVFSSVSELKYFMDKLLFSIPRIIKDGRSTLVDLSLLYELFFVGQDNRNPSGLIRRGQFGKLDFKHMVHSIAGFSHSSDNSEELKDVKGKVSELKQSLKDLRKKISIIRKSPYVAEVSSKMYDSEIMQSKIKIVTELNGNISSIKRSRQREINRKVKLELLVSELHSLNRELSEGSVHCGECGSDKVVYSNQDLTFEVSSKSVRASILESIYESVRQKSDIISEYTMELNSFQDKLISEMEDAPASFQQVVLYQEQILSDRDYNEESLIISNKIKALELQLSENLEYGDSLKKEKNLFDSRVVEEMNYLYKLIDPNGNLKFDDIFTKNDTTFSGSEGQEFYFCKIISLVKLLDHKFPVIVDSFRDGELSSLKEQKMIDLYRKLNRQVILTSTLKSEEYSSDKYSKIQSVNAMDYSSHKDCKALNPSFCSEFLKLISNFDGVVL
jgi:hypothetical protein